MADRGPINIHHSTIAISITGSPRHSNNIRRLTEWNVEWPMANRNLVEVEEHQTLGKCMVGHGGGSGIIEDNFIMPQSEAEEVEAPSTALA